MNMSKKPAKTDAVYSYLVKCASQMRTCTYGEVGKALNIAPIGLGLNQLCYIRDICRVAGLPLLSVLCVQAPTRNAGQPGDGFVPGPIQSYLSAAGKESYVRAHKQAAFTFDWSMLDWSALCVEFGPQIATLYDAA